MKLRIATLLLLLVAGSPAAGLENAPKPNLVFESGGHTEPIWQMLFHPTRPRLISISEDQTIRVWDYQKKRCLQVIRPPRGYGSSGKLLAADVSPDGRLLAVAGNGYFVGETGKFVIPVYLIDLETGKLDGQPIILDNIVFGLSFHKKVPVLAVAGCDSSGVMLWDVSEEKRRLLGRLPMPKGLPGEEVRPGCVEFCPIEGSEQILAGTFLNGNVVRWEVNLRDPKLSKWSELGGHGPGDTGITWCRNGNLASCGADNLLRIYFPGNRKKSETVGLPGKLLTLRSVSDNEFLLTYAGTSRNSLPHPQLLRYEPRKKEWLYENMIVPRNALGVPAPTLNNEWFQTAAVTPGGIFAATSGNDNHEIIVWKLAQGERPEVYYRFGGEVEGLWTVAWAKDGKGFAFGVEPPPPNKPRTINQGFSFKTFSLDPGQLDPKDYQNDLVRVLGRKDGKDEDSSTVTVELKSGQTLDLQVPERLRVRCAAVSSGAPRRLALGTQNDILVYDADSARLIVRLIGHRLDVRCIAFSPLDSNLLLSVGGDQQLYLWNLDSRKEEYCGIGVTVTSTREGWRIDRVEPNSPAARDGQLQQGDFLEQATDPDGRWVKLAGLPFSEEMYPLRGPEASMVKLWVRQGKTGKRSTVELTRKKMASEWPAIDPQLGFFFAGPEWVAGTSNGYYHCSAGGERLMGWQVDRSLSELGTFLPAEAFRESLYQPEVVQKMVTARSVKEALRQVHPRQDEVLQVGRIVPPRVRIVSPTPGEQKRDRVDVETRIEDLRDNKISRENVRLLLDHQVVADPGREAGTPLKPTLVPDAGGIKVIWKDVPIHAGAQVIQAEVRTGNATEVSSPTPIRWGAGGKGDLYLLTFGTSTVPKGDFGWIPAKNDCEQIQSVFREQVGPDKLYNRLIGAELLIDEKATRQNLLDALARIQQQATPADSVVVFISAHAAEEAGRCFLISHDADPRKLNGTAVPMTDVKEYLARTRGRRLLLLDCCFAGTANTIKIETEIKDSRNNSGLIVGCSCQSHQKAHDNCPVVPPRLSLFTYVIVKTLKGDYLEQKSGAVNLNDFEYHVRKNVVHHSLQFKERQVPFFDYPRDLDVLKIDLVQYAK